MLKGVKNHILVELNKSQEGSRIEVELRDKENDIWKANQAPIIVAINGMAFIDGERIGGVYGEIKIQLRRAPPEIAPNVRNING